MLKIRSCSMAVAVLLMSIGATPAAAQRDPGYPVSDACSDLDAVAEVVPADARGTTFMGTYLGDVLSGQGSARQLLMSWDVDRVYAGEAIPADLIMRTPKCLWANLTPGVRYLFSTAATDLDFTAASPQEPTVRDSLAWQILDGDRVRLAPFDTYTQDSYGEEVQAISTLAAALEAVAPDAGEGVGPEVPLEVDFVCTTPTAIPSLEQAAGLTFVGRYIGHERLAGPGIRDFRTVWSVQRVYAGGPLPEVLSLRSTGCYPTTLEAGRRYLFTTSDGHVPGAANALAWRIAPDGALSIAPFGELRRADYRADVRHFASLDEAVGAIPGTSGPEFPLGAPDRTPG